MENKTVLVTGASRGLGRAIAVAFARAGAQVVAIGRDAAAMNETVAEVAALGAGSIRPVLLDVCDEDAMRSLIGELDRLDIAINNAGIARVDGLLETSTESFRSMMEINVVAAFVVMRESARKMIEGGGGHIINIASDAAVRGIPGMTHYTASKHALLGMSRTVGLELQDQGVRVTSFNPGPIATEILGPGMLFEGGMATEDVATLLLHLAETPPRLNVQEVLVTPGR